MPAMIRMLNADYDLTSISDLELTDIMGKLCSDYAMCRAEMSTATLEVWANIIRVAEELIKRK